MTRHVRQIGGSGEPRGYLVDMARGFSRPHDEGQPYAIYLGVEKNGMIAQLTAWFGDTGVAILALGGYASQTFKDITAAHIRRDGRPSVLLYAGDFDPSGEDIDRDFVEQVGGFSDVRRIALSSEQVDEYGLPPAPGKAADSRAAAFIARHGELVQVELDALDPNDLEELYRDAFDEFWDQDAYEAVLALEQEQRARLVELAESLDDDDED